MKVKELIRQLQEQDPTGEIEVEIGGHRGGAIVGASYLPPVYDGWSEYFEKKDGKTKFVLDFHNPKIRIYWYERCGWAAEYHGEKTKEELFEVVAHPNDQDRRQRLEKLVDEAMAIADEVMTGKREECP